MINGLLLADLHFGQMKLTTDSNFLKSLTKTLEQELYLTRKDFVIICGDLFDRKLYMNEDATKQLIKFLSELFRICYFQKTKVRFLYGTQSHEMNQYHILSLANYVDDYDNDEADIRIVEKHCREELLSNFYVTYLPEEFITSKEIYEDLKDKSNLVIYHGAIEDVFPNLKQNSNHSSPVTFTGDDLLKYGDYVYAGHYHCNTIVKPNVKYIGSYWRWQHGELPAKGYYTVQFDKNICTDEFHITKAPLYKTINISNEIQTNELQDLIRKERETSPGVKLAFKMQFDNPELYEIVKSNITNSNEETIIKIDKKVSKTKDNVSEDGLFSIFKSNASIIDKIDAYHRAQGIKISKDELIELIKKEG
jgi:DNA repair exonuclease SbcCD nuclease subunit